MNRRDLLRLCGVAAVAGLSAACTSPAPPSTATQAAPPTAAPTPVPPAPTAAPTSTPAPITSVRVAIEADPDTLDPAGQSNPTGSSIVDAMVETLVRLQPDGSLGPGLARTWDESPDGRVYTFELHQNVHFHDGSLLTADAATSSLQRFLNPQLRVPLRAPFDANLVDGIMAVDPLTLRIYLKASSRLFLRKLAATDMGIVSPNHAHAFADTYNDEPVGTGPFRFKERRKGESVVLERFDGYWGPAPYYPAVQFRIVPEIATRESLLLANQVEAIVNPPLSDLPALQNNPALKVLLAPTARSVFVAMDLTLPGGTPLAIKKVRQALNYAVDRDGIIRNVLFGAATPMDAPMAPSLVGYSRTGPYGYDPNRARQLLLEGGTPRLQLRFMYPTGRAMLEATAAQIAQALAGNLHEVGVDTDLAGSDWASFLAAVNVPEDRGTAHMHLFSWAPAMLDASQQMTQFIRSQWPPQGLATSHYTNARVEQLVEQAAEERDNQKRMDAYAEAQRLVWDDAPWIFLWVPSFPIVHSARLKGISSLPNEKFSAVYAEPA
ncbi:MAG: ABC transporter substrate-binding protein [Chloroflexi bacterium]|nr:ABC transporter substrate-binding protein [Chloroflexota bacterium]